MPLPKDDGIVKEIRLIITISEKGMVPIRKTCGWFELSGGNGGPLPLSEYGKPNPPEIAFEPILA